MSRRNTLLASAAPAASAPAEEPLPKRVDRKRAAEIIGQMYGVKPSPRTIEAWPLAWRRLFDGKAYCETAELLACAAAKFEAAPVIRGGRRQPEQAAA